MRTRDPAFDMIRFMAAVKLDAPVVVKAFLTHDLETLGKHCGPELMERFAGGQRPVWAHLRLAAHAPCWHSTGSSTPCAPTCACADTGPATAHAQQQQLLLKAHTPVSVAAR